MKKNYVKLITIELLMLIAILFNTFISGVFTATNIEYLLFWTLLFVALKVLVGFAKNKHLYQIDVFQIVFIYSITYSIAIYIFGFFFGFILYPYHLSKVLNIITQVLFLIIFQELVRYIVVSKGKGSRLTIGLLIITFSMFNILLGLKAFPITDGMSIFTLLGLLILPSIINNVLLTYLSYKNGYKTPILYRIIFELILIYILPIYPDLGVYLESILGITFPIVLFLKLNSFFAKEQPTTRKKAKMKKFVFWIPTVAVLTSVVILTSGLFKLHAMAIGSGSMSPSINKGDVIIIEKLSKEEIEELEVGDVVAFEYDKRIIVHRIIRIDKKYNYTLYKTQGDNNDDPDNWDLEEKQIKGIVRYKISYVGYPTVWLEERLK